MNLGVAATQGVAPRRLWAHPGLSHCAPLGLESCLEDANLHLAGLDGNDGVSRERTQRAQRSWSALRSLRSFAAVWQQLLPATPLTTALVGRGVRSAVRVGAPEAELEMNMNLDATGAGAVVCDVRQYDS